MPECPNCGTPTFGGEECDCDEMPYFVEFEGSLKLVDPNNPSMDGDEI